MKKSRYSRLSSLEDDNSERYLGKAPWKSILIAVLVFSMCLNLILLLSWRGPASVTCIRPKLISSPAIEAISYEKKRLSRDIDNNPYTGEPRPEFDKVWHDVIEPLAIRVTNDELKAIDQSSIPLKDSQGFIAEMAVYHELHCVKRIRRHLYLDHYYPNQTADEQRREKLHIDHCLEYWREAAMCRGDVSLATFQWAEGKPFSRVWSDHECVNWDGLDQWARARMVDLSDYSLLEGFEKSVD